MNNGEPTAPKSSDYWMQLVERRLNEMHDSLRALKERIDLRDAVSDRNKWDIEKLSEDMKETKADLQKARDAAVSATEYALLKKVVFGFVGLVLIGFATVVIKYFMGKGGVP